MFKENRCLSLIIFTMAVLIIFLGVKEAEAQEDWLSGWVHRRAVTLSNSTGGALTDYEVKVELTTGNFDYSKCSAGGADIRFIKTGDNQIEANGLSYWIEQWSSISTSTIWVKYSGQLATGDSEVYMYYGNADALAVSSRANTFTEVKTSYQSGLAWRGDGQGDYTFSGQGTMSGTSVETDTGYVRYDAAPGTYELTTAITASGTIETITVNWVHTSGVGLEVSADNGVNWTSVKNGIPLTSGFTAGSQLKWKATLTEGAKLKGVCPYFT